MKDTANLTRVLDGYAISASAICAIHCLFLPLMLVTFPALGSTFFGEEAFHQILLWLVIPLSVVSLFLGCKKHTDKAVAALGLTGLAILVFTAVAGHDLLGEHYERIATLSGASILAAAHIRNFVTCRREQCSH